MDEVVRFVSQVCRPNGIVGLGRTFEIRELRPFAAHPADAPCFVLERQAELAARAPARGVRN